MKPGQVVTPLSILGKIHPDAAKGLAMGGLLAYGTTELSKNIGKLARFNNPTCAAEEDLFQIVGIQKMWGYDDKGVYRADIIGYRVVGSQDTHKFGRTAIVNKLVFVSDSN